MQLERSHPAGGPAFAGYSRTAPDRIGVGGAVPIAPILLFLAASETDEPDTAARDAALELGRMSDRPVLLLDLSMHEAAQYAHFDALGALLMRPPRRLPTNALVAFFFHAVRDSNLWISTLESAGAARDEAIWQRLVVAWPSVRRRLLDLFGTVVIAAPSTMRSPRGIALAAVADATILTLRDTAGMGQRAALLCDQVVQAGGRPVGVVITGGAAVETGRNRQDRS